jgi:hypothetical protein
MGYLPADVFDGLRQRDQFGVVAERPVGEDLVELLTVEATAPGAGVVQLVAGRARAQAEATREPSTKPGAQHAGRLVAALRTSQQISDRDDEFGPGDLHRLDLLHRPAESPGPPQDEDSEGNDQLHQSQLDGLSDQPGECSMAATDW